MEPTDKEQADAKAIGGLRNTSESLSKLSFTSAYGSKLGEILKQALDGHPSWIDQTCEAIGTNDEDRIAAGMEPIRPPAEAVSEIRRLLAEQVADTTPPRVTAKRTNVDAHLLEGWRAAAKDPETEMFGWLTIGGPMGILHIPKNVGHLPRLRGRS